MNKTARNLQVGAWCLTILVCSLAIAVWLQSLNGRFASISTYRIFPLLGLLAFSLMWAHYIMSAVRQWVGVEKKYLKDYFEITSWLVLFAIVLHPGLLVWQLWRDGFGLPPTSVLEEYVAPAMRLAATLGTVSLVAFLAYETRKLFEGKAWWKWVQYASDAAMLAILYHGWRLGSHLQSGWYKSVWVMYVVTFVAALGYMYYRRYTGKVANGK